MHWFFFLSETVSLVFAERQMCFMLWAPAHNVWYDMTTRPPSASLITFAIRDMTLCHTDILRTIKASQDVSKRCSGKCFIINRRWPFAETTVLVPSNKTQQSNRNRHDWIKYIRIAMPVTTVRWYPRQNIACLDGAQHEIWSYFNMNTVFPGIRIPVINIRLSWDRLILMREIPLSVRPHRYIERPLCKPQCTEFDNAVVLAIV